MVRKREIRKSTFREIKSSFGRFMAIFAIIALGVGFFSGLKVTRKAMVATVGEYLDEHGFFDFRILSTLGLEQEDVDHFAAEEGVAAAEGSMSLDVLYRLSDDTQGVVKTYSLPEKINTVKLIAGRLPEADDECVADSRMLGEDMIGSVIYLSEGNDQDTLDSFAHDAYMVVGIVQSPLYLQYERGNTSLGNGRTDGFLYLPLSGFDTDYYTDVYVRFGEEYELYSDAYEEMTDEREDIWEEYADAAAARRYDSILSDANEELSDARQEFEDKKKEGEEELADAKKKLDDAAEELADGEQALSDAKDELADAEAVLSEKEKELEEAKTTLAEKEQEFADGEQTYNDSLAEWQKNDDAIEAAKRQLDEGYSELAAKQSQVDESRAELQAAMAAYGLTDQSMDMDAGQLASLQSEQAQQLAYFQSAQRELDNAQSQIDEAKARLDEAASEVHAGDREISKIWWEKLVPAAEELENGRQELADAEEKIADGEKALADAKKELADAQATLAEKEQELEDGKAKYEDGRKEYEDAKQEFDEKIADAEEELADAQEKVDDIEAPQTYVLGRDTNVGYVCFENDSGIVDGIADIFPVFFFLVAALVCITTMNRMVEEQRTQIGVLKALGYGEGTIMSKYMIYSGLAAVTGCIFGFFAGTFLFPRAIWAAYGIMYNTEPIVYVFDGKLAVLSLAVALLCSVGTTWLSCRVELSETSAQLMRPKAPKAGKRVFLEYIPFVWKRLSFLRKVSVRNIFRYKKRLFMMIIGISGCTALLVTGFGIRDSIADVASRQFDEIQIYDIGVDFDSPLDDTVEEELSGLAESGLKGYISIMEKNMDLETEKGVKSIYLVAGEPDEMGDFVNLHTKSGEAIAYPQKGEGVISNKLSEQYGIRVGDTITLSDGDMKSLTLTVSGVQENYIYNYVYISKETWEAQMGEAPECKKAYVNLQEDTDAHVLSAELMKLDEVTSVTVNADTSERIDNMMKSLNIIVLVVILCAAGLAFVVLYNLTNINITERIREIATIKVLGFQKKETASYVFRENIILTGMGILVGLVLGKLLHRFVMNEIRIDLITFHTYVSPVSYLYSAVLTLLFTWIVNRVMGRKLEGISMTESLKSVD